MAAATRKTPQHTVGIDDELWQTVNRIARVRRERVAQVIRASLVRYAEEHAHLDPGPDASA
jgi:hypothetical protein